MAISISASALRKPITERKGEEGRKKEGGSGNISSRGSVIMAIVAPHVAYRGCCVRYIIMYNGVYGISTSSRMLFCCSAAGCDAGVAIMLLLPAQHGAWRMP